MEIAFPQHRFYLVRTLRIKNQKPLVQGQILSYVGSLRVTFSDGDAHLLSMGAVDAYNSILRFDPLKRTRSVRTEIVDLQEIGDLAAGINMIQVFACVDAGTADGKATFITFFWVAKDSELPNVIASVMLLDSICALQKSKSG